MQGKIRVKKAESGNVFVIRTVKLVNEEQAEVIVEKRDEARKKRTEKNKIKRQAKKSRRED